MTPAFNGALPYVVKATGEADIDPMTAAFSHKDPHVIRVQRALAAAC